MMRIFDVKTMVKDTSSNLRSIVGNQRGESIIEALVSVLIGGMALLMLAVVLASTTKVIADSGEVMHEYYDQANDMATVSGSTKAGSISLVSQGTASPLVIAQDENDADITASKQVRLYEMTISERPVISYWADSSVLIPGASDAEAGDGQ